VNRSKRELLIPTIVLLYGMDTKVAGSLALLISLPTMLVAFFRYSRDRAFAVLGQHPRILILMPRRRDNREELRAEILVQSTGNVRGEPERCLRGAAQASDRCVEADRVELDDARLARGRDD
jgi:hypothetical protein